MHAMFEKCTNCQERVVIGRKRSHGTFCSAECEAFHRHPDFCESCLASTLPDDDGSTATLNGVGTRFYYRRKQCPTCGSIVRHKFMCVFFIPLIPLGRCRLKYCAPRRYHSRLLRPGAFDDAERRYYYHQVLLVVVSVVLLISLLSAYG